MHSKFKKNFLKKIFTSVVVFISMFLFNSSPTLASDTAPGCGSDDCLSVPGASEYSGIAAQTSFREALITWTNFFLGFLSLVAMIALIYSGFLYVTAAGNDEQTGKAKKIIIWVVIGIMVILLAYALVNTLIEDAPTGQG